MPYKNADMTRAARRNRDHMKRVTVSDVTAAQELAMRRRTRKCPLCSTWMTGKPNLPNSKHLDHIIPICTGGTHTHGNVRIICADCNLKRPKDGSDYSGPVTLWAQEPGIVTRQRTMCGNGLHPWTPENIMIVSGGRKQIVKKVCRKCRRANEKRRRPSHGRLCACGQPVGSGGRTVLCTACIKSAGRKAAELHASGMSWQQVAAEVGYGSAWGAAYAAKRIGYMQERKQQREVRHCTCGSLMLGARCDSCRWRNAVMALAFRENGWTLRQIAPLLGYSSISSVTNLLKTVVSTDTPDGADHSKDLRRLHSYAVDNCA